MTKHKWEVDIQNKSSPMLDKFLGTVSQTLVVGAWVGGFASPMIASYLAFRGGYRTTLVAYATIITLGEFWPRSLTMLSSRFNDCYVTFLVKPFNSHSIKLEVLPKDKEKEPAIMCYHPHGAFSWGFICGGGWREFYSDIKLTGLVAESLMHAPFFGLFFAKMMGSIEPADKFTMINKMKRGESFGLIPGGFEEATISCQNKDRVYLKKRKGFVKYALQHGYSLVPVYTFGECNTYSNLQGMWKLRHTMNSWKLPAIVPFGRWYCPLLPKKVAVNTIGGKPLKLPRIDQPSKGDIDEWHGKYVEHLKAHYARHADEFAKYNESKELEVW